MPQAGWSQENYCQHEKLLGTKRWERPPQTKIPLSVGLLRAIVQRVPDAWLLQFPVFAGVVACRKVGARKKKLPGELRLSRVSR
jgi:hypothetical protein